MENKLNIAELLKDCPKGMELDCTMFENLYFDYILKPEDLILCYTEYDNIRTSVTFNKDGAYSGIKQAKCVIFPKGKDTWEGFQRPAKDGDIVVCEEQKKITQMFVVQSENKEGRGKCYFGYDFENDDFFKEDIWEWDRLASEKERQKLFDAIRAKGYRWDAETKILIQEFKDGDILAYDNDRPYMNTIYIYRSNDKWNTSYYVAVGQSGEFYNDGKGALNSNCDRVRLATEEERKRLFREIKNNGYKWNAETKILERLVKPNFKVGDVIQDVDSYKVKITDISIEDECYEYESVIAKGVGGIPFDEQDEWTLVPIKFDINTLKIFESKVLVRDNKDENWKPAIFGGFKKERGVPYVVVGGIWFKYLIPYEGNERLTLSKNDCSDFYKTWE